MILSPQQIQQLLNIIDQNQALIIGREFGLEFLSDYDKFVLDKFGVDLDQLYLPQTDTIYTSFHFGLLSDALADIQFADKLTYNDLYEYISKGEYIPLTQQEIASINSVKTQSLASLRSIGNKIFQDINQILPNTSRSVQEQFIRDEIEQGVKYKKTVREIANEIAHKTGDWSRDFDRIVQYTSQTAYEHGKAAALQRQYGEDMLVYKNVYQGACKYCIKMYLTKGLGSQPRIFKLSELIANGSNIGKKVADWKPTLDPVHPYCFDDQTEVLTNEGWKFFKDLNKQELFLSVNLQTGEGEWKRAVNWIDQYYEGPMYSFQNKNFDLVTTPNHHHVIQTYSSQKLRLVETVKLPKEAQFLTHLPKWEGKERKTFTFDKIKYNGDDFLCFLGYFISEGCIIDYKGQKRLHISQSKKKYYEEIAQSCELLFEVVFRCKDYIQVNLSSKNHKQLLSFLSFGKSFEKYIPQDVKNCTPRQIEIFLAAFCQGDGSVYKGREWDGYKCKDYRLYYTSSKRIADDLSELILKIGKKPGFKVKPAVEIYDPKRDKSYMQNNDIIVISELTNKYTYRNTVKEEIFHYSGKIYDVELEANHTLFVRRNGKVTVSGNCRCNLVYVSQTSQAPIWNKEKKIFETTTQTQPTSRPRPKVRAIVGGKEVWV